MDGQFTSEEERERWNRVINPPFMMMPHGQMGEEIGRLKTQVGELLSLNQFLREIVASQAAALSGLSKLAALTKPSGVETTCANTCDGDGPKEPWKALGISERTYWRRKKAGTLPHA